MENRSTDFLWFTKNRAGLYEKYGDSFLAIKNQQVIGVYQSYADGVKQTALKEELGTFIVQHCTKDESGYTNYIYSMNY